METQITVGVTGHRHLFEADKPRLREEIRRFFLENFDANQPVRVLDGLAEGADQLVAQTVLELKANERPNLRLTAFLPMPIQFYEADFDADSNEKPSPREAFYRILLRADETVELPLLPENRQLALAGGDFNRVLQYDLLGSQLAMRSTYLLALWDGRTEGLKPGGTGDVVRRVLSTSPGEKKVWHIVTPQNKKGLTRPENALHGGWIGNSPGGITVPGTYATLEEACEKAPDGAVITIKPGKYMLGETIRLSRNLTLRGETGRAGDVVIECPEFGTFEITGGTPQIFCCTITSRSGAGICIKGQEADPVVEDCIVKDCGDAGVVVIKEGHGQFRGCEICQNTGPGICVQDSGNPTFIGCKIHDGKSIGVAVLLEGRGEFRNCEIYANDRSGIQVVKEGDPTFTGCKIHDGKNVGVFVVRNGLGKFRDCEIFGNDEGGICVEESGAPTFTRCKIHDGKGSGVLLNNSAGEFTNCEIYRNEGDEVALLEASDPTFTGCSIHDGQAGGVFVAQKSRGKFTDCNIYGNKEAGIYVGEAGDPTFTGCKVHDGKDFGVWVFKQGLGSFRNCDIYGNDGAGIAVCMAGDPTVAGCKIHDGKGGGVSVYDKGMGTYNNNILRNNKLKSEPVDWNIAPFGDCKVQGSGNDPELPETFFRNSFG